MEEDVLTEFVVASYRMSCQNCDTLLAHVGLGFPIADGADEEKFMRAMAKALVIAYGTECPACAVMRERGN